MTIRLQLWHPRSMSGKAIAKHCGILLHTPQRIAKYGDCDNVISWGSTKERSNGRYINPPNKVQDACNKIASFEAMDAANVPTLPWTTSMATAHIWWEAGYTVVIRKLLRASKGRGIVLASK